MGVFEASYTISLGGAIAIALFVIVGLPMFALGFWKAIELTDTFAKGGKVGIVPPTPKDESQTEEVEEEEGNGEELSANKCHNNMISAVILGAIVIGFLYFIIKDLTAA